MENSYMPRRGRPPRNFEATTEQAEDHIDDDAGYEPAKPAGSPIERPPMRQAMREPSSVERAKARAKEIRAHSVGDIDFVDEFYIPESIIPDGWSYEWKRFTIYNKEDPSHQIELARAGWEPVPVSRHPEMMPMNATSDIIERKGMILMERPADISEEYRRRDLRRALEQVRSKEEQVGAAPNGTMTRDHPNIKPKIKKDFSMPIPESDGYEYV